MKKYFLYLIFGWFFAVQSPANTPGAVVSMVVGPFQSEGACKAEADDLKSMLESIGVPHKFHGCRFKQEA